MAVSLPPFDDSVMTLLLQNYDRKSETGSDAAAPSALSQTQSGVAPHKPV